MTATEKLPDDHYIDIFQGYLSPADIAFGKELARILKPCKSRMMDVALHFPEIKFPEGEVDGIVISTLHYKQLADTRFDISFMKSEHENGNRLHLAVCFYQNKDHLTTRLSYGQVGAYRDFANTVVTLFEKPEALKKVLKFDGMISG